MKYEEGDLIKMHFVLHNSSINGKSAIKAWSDNKDLVKFYLEFHNCKNYTTKSLTDTTRNVNNIINENNNDEITIYNACVRSNGKRHKSESGFSIPATGTEIVMLRDQTSTFMSAMINYHHINDMWPYLKNRYKRSLTRMLLPMIIDIVINNYDRNNLLNYIEFDELILLVKLFNEDFD